MTVNYMSQAELNRLTVVMDFAEGRLTARQAAQMLRLTSARRGGSLLSLEPGSAQ
jgi:hypothetical protein